MVFHGRYHPTVGKAHTHWGHKAPFPYTLAAIPTQIFLGLARMLWRSYRQGFLFFFFFFLFLIIFLLFLMKRFSLNAYAISKKKKKQQKEGASASLLSEQLLLQSVLACGLSLPIKEQLGTIWLRRRNLQQQVKKHFLFQLLISGYSLPSLYSILNGINSFSMAPTLALD